MSLRKDKTDRRDPTLQEASPRGGRWGNRMPFKRALAPCLVLSLLAAGPAPVRAQQPVLPPGVEIAPRENSAGLTDDEILRQLTGGRDPATVPTSELEQRSRQLLDRSATPSSTPEAAQPMAATTSNLAPLPPGLSEERLGEVLRRIYRQRYGGEGDPTEFFRRLEDMGMKTEDIRRLAGRVSIFYRPPTEMAEAQYYHVSNTLFIPTEYKEEGSNRIRYDLGISQVDTVVHEFDHAEKDLLEDELGFGGRTLADKMRVGAVRGGIAGIGAFFATQLLGKIPPLVKALPWLGKLTKPWPSVALIGVPVALGILHGLYRHVTDKGRGLTEREQNSFDAVQRISRALREDPRQRTWRGLPFTQSNPKSWEISGYFMGASALDIGSDIQQIEFHNLHGAHRNMTDPAAIEALGDRLQVPPSIAQHQYGRARSNFGGARDAYFVGNPIEFDYQAHESTLQQLYNNALGLQPPSNPSELVERLNARDSERWREMRARVLAARQKKIAELRGQQASLPADTGTAAPPAAAPGAGAPEGEINHDGIENRE